MKITFDPNNEADVVQVTALLDSLGLVQSVKAEISTNPENRVDPNNPDDSGEVDSNGMPWNPEIHASTRTKNADGTWKVQRGKADEAKAAVEAFKAQQAPSEVESQPEPEHNETPAPAPQMMDMPGATMPAPSPEIPAPVITYEQIVERFTKLMEAGKITDYQVIYNAAGVVNPADLQTNESLRAALWAELDKVENA